MSLNVQMPAFAGGRSVRSRRPWHHRVRQRAEGTDRRRSGLSYCPRRDPWPLEEIAQDRCRAQRWWPGSFGVHSIGGFIRRARHAVLDGISGYLRGAFAASNPGAGASGGWQRPV